MSQNYFKLSLLEVSPQEEDLVQDLCFTYNASGISENLLFDQDPETYQVETLEQDSHNLDVYFEVAPAPEFFSELKSRFPKIHYKFEEAENKDWLAEWKKSYNPFELYLEYWVVPTWHRSPTTPEKTIQIDPGMAFGTGTHATTQMASELIIKVLNQLSKKDLTLIDVGTGTGLLAILAKKWGLKKAVATDIDPEAQRVAIENALINKTELEVLDYQIDRVEEKFDLVVANILDGVLVQLQQDLKRILKDSGYMIVSGIIKEREPLFLSRFELPPNYKYLERLQKDEWLAFLIGPEK